MISPSYCIMMARYNRWQNNSLYRESDTLSDAERRENRGAFFESILSTLNHVLWGDSMWMSRFDAWERPAVGGSQSTEMFTDWEKLKAARKIADARIADWAARVSDADLAGDLTWYSGILKAEMSKPLNMLVVQFFNHQTHHRGQVHAMLTAAGCKPDDTDIPLMPEGA